MIWLIHQFVQVVEVAKIGKHFEIRNPQSAIPNLHAAYFLRAPSRARANPGMALSMVCSSTQ